MWDIDQGDELYKLISNENSTLEITKLFDGKTEQSRMGKIRKKMRTSLGIEEDELNFSLLDSLRRDKPNLNLNGEDIIIIDPLIKEEDIKIDNQKEEIQEVIVEPRNENITSKLEEKTVNENTDKTIFKEKTKALHL